MGTRAGWKVEGYNGEKEYAVLTHSAQVDGKQKVMYALTKIKGVGRRYSNLVCKKADVDLNKRYGSITIAIRVVRGSY